MLNVFQGFITEDNILYTYFQSKHSSMFQAYFPYVVEKIVLQSIKHLEHTEIGPYIK